MKYIRESKGYPFIPHKSIQNFKIVLLYRITQYLEYKENRILMLCVG